MSETALGWSDAQFLDEVQRRFGFRLGRLLKVGRRVPYPLSLSVSERTSAGRCVIIGNAAQGLHPVAGMGFNLGLRDVASLAELIAERRSMPGEERVGHGVAADASGAAGMDAGDPAMLAQYDAWRADDRRGIIGFTDGLVRVFSNPWGPIRQARNLALLAFDLLPPAKAALSALSMGAARRAPKLARGVALSGVPRHAQEPGV
jgi:2-octaprenyl-6-methoxyphenol hydroxylase